MLLLALLMVASLVSVAPVPARAQGCGTLNPNCIVPTAPPGDNSNRAASTAFVTNALGGGGGGGNVSNVGTPTSGQVAVWTTATTIEGLSLSATLDATFGTTQGSVIYRGSSGWAALGPGTSGYFLETQGGSANPIWASVSATGCTVSGGSQYQILINNGASGCSSSPSASVNGGALSLGASGTLGSVQMGNGSSGTITLEPTTGALGSITEYLPVASGDTLVALAATQTLTGKSIAASEINSGQLAAAQMLALTQYYVYQGNASNYPAAVTLSAALDAAIGSTQGDILYRDSAVWKVLAPGTSGYFLETQGSAANPTWAAATGSSGCSVSGGSQYQILVNNGSSGCASDANASVNAGALSLGASGTAGTIALGNATSGTVTIGTVIGALGSVTASLPANSGIIAELNYAQTWSAAQSFNNGDLKLNGSSSGAMTLEAPAAASTYVVTFQAATDTVAVLGTAQTFSAVETFSGHVLMTGLTTSGTIANAVCTDSSGNVISNASADCFPTGGLSAVNTFTNSHTLTNADNGGAVVMNCSGACNLTFPTSLATNFSTNVWVQGAGTVTLVASSTTIYTIGGAVGSGGDIHSLAQYTGFSCFQTTTSTFACSGSLAP